MKLTKRQYAILKASIKPFNISANLFNLQFVKQFVKFNLKYFQRRRHQIIGSTISFRNDRVTVLYNELKIKGGYAKQRASGGRIFYGIKIATKRKRKLAKKSATVQKNDSQKKSKNFKSHNGIETKSFNESVKQNGDNLTNVIQNENDVSKLTPHQSDTNLNLNPTDDDRPEPEIGNASEGTAEFNGFNEDDEFGTGNIWNLDLEKVAVEMTDENLTDIYEDQTHLKGIFFSSFFN